MPGDNLLGQGCGSPRRQETERLNNCGIVALGVGAAARRNGRQKYLKADPVRELKQGEQHLGGIGWSRLPRWVSLLPVPRGYHMAGELMRLTPQG